MDVDISGAGAGDKVELNRVLLISGDEGVIVGAPAIEGAKVMATSQGPVKGDKIIVLKFKHKDHYTRKAGHRQKYTRLVINDIVKPDAN